MLKNSFASYGYVAKFLHWTIGITIICMIISGFYMTLIDESAFKYSIYDIHKAFGVLTLTFVMIRIFWRLINIQPSLPINMLHWQKVLYVITHYSIYFLMLLMPISGLMMSLFAGYPINMFGLLSIGAFKPVSLISTLFGYIHTMGAFIFIALIGLHIVAALYHHFYLKDEILKRML